MKKNYVLDTNVLIHDPSSITRFQENDIYIPIYVLEEIDGLKNDPGEKGKSAREVVRTIDDLRFTGPLSKGVALSELAKEIEGHLFVYVPSFAKDRIKITPTPPGEVDQLILQTALEIKDNHPAERTILVTMDVNLRVRADALELQTAPYEFQSVNVNTLNNDVIEIVTQTSSEIDMFYAQKEWELSKEEMEANNVEMNSCIMLTDGASKSALCRHVGEGKIKPLQFPKEGVMGIRPRNKEQQYALDLLLDDNINLVTLMGSSGTGKTILACAVGLLGVLEGKYSKFLVSRPVTPMGNNDIGFLPGSELEKIGPWMRPIYDNLDYILMSGGVKKKYNRTYEDLFNDGVIQIESLSYIRGRSIPNQFILIDEVQNASPLECKTIITRAGEGSKIVLTGDPQQIDSPYMTAASNGLSVTVKKLRNNPIVAHLMLRKGERSPLANIAASSL